MGLRINTNVASINAQRNLRGTNADMRRAMERLSSGAVSIAREMMLQGWPSAKA